MKKICTNCRQKLHTDDFYSDRNKCKKCVSIYHARRKQDKFDFVDDVKRAYGCQFCYEDDICCFDFHHLDPQTKTSAISIMITTRQTISKLIDELNKCVCVCSNCHRKIHAGKIKVYKKHLCRIKQPAVA